LNVPSNDTLHQRTSRNHQACRALRHEGRLLEDLGVLPYWSLQVMYHRHFVYSYYMIFYLSDVA
jgi:hypothetical protein